jgi:predicted  nucleic acid-binding Zn-ribbon protein
VADAPWRCSQCGTVNEPVANACRTCGRWPSLFELEGSTIEVEEEPATAIGEEDDLYAAPSVEVEEIEPEVSEAEIDDVELPREFEADDEDAEPPKPTWQRLGSLIVPIGVVLYILISALVDR